MKREEGELLTSQRTAIIYAHKNGISASNLADDFCCARKTIYNTINRFKKHNTVESLPRTGRPQVFGHRARHHLLILARRHPFYSYNQLSASTIGHLSRMLIHRVLKQYNLLKYRTTHKIPISK